MATQIYLSNIDSDVSGYKLAFVGGRNPNPPSSVATAVTTTTVSGDDIEMTLTAGGTVAKWITKPLLADVTLDGELLVNMWGLEDDAATNAGFNMRIAEYTTSQQADSLDSNFGTELGTTASVNNWLTAAVTSVTVDAGNRIAIVPRIVAVGTMAAGTATFKYDGATADADGDSYVLFPEDIRVDEVQQGNGSVPPIKGIGVSYATNLRDTVQSAVDAELIGSNWSAQAIIDQADELADIL